MKKIIGLLFILSIFAFVSCSKKHVAMGTQLFAAEDCLAENAVAPRLAMSKMATVNDSYEGNNLVSAEDSGSADLASSFERKLIRNGSLSLEVTDLEKCNAAIEAWVKDLDGYVSSSNNGERSSNYTVRIPCERFDEAMDSAGNLGSLKNKNVSSQDVSDQYYDLKARLETKKVLKNKLDGYLKQAYSMQDILKVERELNSVQSEIESMEGRLKRLNDQIDYSTINIYVSLPFNTNQGGGIQLPDFGDGVRHFLSNLVSFFCSLFKVLLYAVICGLPLLIIIAFLYWLLFGKIGLIIKLFNKLKK